MECSPALKISGRLGIMLKSNAVTKLLTYLQLLARPAHSRLPEFPKKTYKHDFEGKEPSLMMIPAPWASVHIIFWTQYQYGDPGETFCVRNRPINKISKLSLEKVTNWVWKKSKLRISPAQECDWFRNYFESRDILQEEPPNTSKTSKGRLWTALGCVFLMCLCSESPRRRPSVANAPMKISGRYSSFADFIDSCNEPRHLFSWGIHKGTENHNS